jgi:hypothetical protein
MKRQLIKMMTFAYRSTYYGTYFMEEQTLRRAIHPRLIIRVSLRIARRATRPSKISNS